MVDPSQKYREALAMFALPGNRWNAKGALTYWGKSAGLTAEEIVADARAAGVTDRDADIRRGWEDARPKGEAVRGSYGPRAKPKPAHPFAAHVRNMIGSVEGCDLDPISELSPYLDFVGQPERVQTSLFLRAAFRPRELLFVFRNDAPTVGTLGANLWSAADWVQAVERGETLPGDLVVPNGFTGKQGTTTAGKQSFIAQSCLAAFTFMVLEMDDAPLQKQAAFWRSFIMTSPLARALVALTFSGGRSIHALLNVGCGSLAEWQAVRERIRALFASDADAAFRLDDQAMRPRTGTRIAGVRRFGNGVLQRLIYLNPRARAGTMWSDAAEPPKPTATDKPDKPPCGAAAGMKLCGVCSAFGRCPFAAPDAVSGSSVIKGREVQCDDAF